MHIEVFRLNATNHWELEENDSLNDQLHIKAIDEAISLTDIYEGVKMKD